MIVICSISCKVLQITNGFPELPVIKALTGLNLNSKNEETTLEHLKEIKKKLKNIGVILKMLKNKKTGNIGLIIERRKNIIAFEPGANIEKIASQLNYYQKLNDGFNQLSKDFLSKVIGEIVFKYGENYIKKRKEGLEKTYFLKNGLVQYKEFEVKVENASKEEKNRIKKIVTSALTIKKYNTIGATVAGMLGDKSNDSFYTPKSLENAVHAIKEKMKSFGYLNAVVECFPIIKDGKASIFIIVNPSVKRKVKEVKVKFIDKTQNLKKPSYWIAPTVLWKLWNEIFGNKQQIKRGLTKMHNSSVPTNDEINAYLTKYNSSWSCINYHLTYLNGNEYNAYITLAQFQNVGLQTGTVRIYGCPLPSEQVNKLFKDCGVASDTPFDQKKMQRLLRLLNEYGGPCTPTYEVEKGAVNCTIQFKPGTGPISWIYKQDGGQLEVLKLDHQTITVNLLAFLFYGIFGKCLALKIPLSFQLQYLELFTRLGNFTSIEDIVNVIRCFCVELSLELPVRIFQSMLKLNLVSRIKYSTTADISEILYLSWYLTWRYKGHQLKLSTDHRDDHTFSIIWSKNFDYFVGLNTLHSFFISTGIKTVLSRVKKIFQWKELAKMLTTHICYSYCYEKSNLSNSFNTGIAFSSCNESSNYMSLQLPFFEHFIGNKPLSKPTVRVLCCLYMEWFILCKVFKSSDFIGVDIAKAFVGFHFFGYLYLLEKLKQQQISTSVGESIKITNQTIVNIFKYLNISCDMLAYEFAISFLHICLIIYVASGFAVIVSIGLDSIKFIVRNCAEQPLRLEASESQIY